MEETTKMVIQANGKARIRAFLNTLALKRAKRARTLKACSLCACAIEVGSEFRDAGPGRRAHEWCYQAVSQEWRNK